MGSTECMICLDTVAEDKSMHLECSHVFHTACMLKYIAYSKDSVNCPICRKQILKLSQPVTQEAQHYREITIHPMFPDSGETQRRTDRASRVLSGIGILILVGFWLYAGSSN